MERTITDKSVDELIKIIEDSMSAIIRDYGHVDEGYCLSCDDEPFNALEELKKRFSERPKWPEELHNQYLVVLDERDKLQERVDSLEELLRYLRELLSEG